MKILHRRINVRLRDYEIVKRHKRLCIVDRDDKIVYSPPDFLRPYIQSRHDMEGLCANFNNRPGDPQIIHIVHFENLLHRRMRGKNGNSF